jgi:hypothetical protein
MAKRKDVPTRHEVSEKIETGKREMEEKETDLEKVASDVEIVRHTLEQLDFGGTAEGSEELESSIESAEDVTIEVFDGKDEGLEQIQNETQKFEEELEGRRESSESDRRKISDAKVETNETATELAKADEVVSREIDFLVDQYRRADGAREKSNSIQERLQARVHTGKRGR